MNVPSWLWTLFIRTRLVLHQGSSIQDSSGNVLISSNGSIGVSAIDTDNTLAANSDTLVPSQKAVKAYIDNHIATLGLSGLQDGDVAIYDAAEGKFVRSDDHPTIEVLTAPKE